METKKCPICKEIKPFAKYVLNPDGSIRKHVCKACYGRKYRAQLKLEMLEAFGWACQCCGESNPYFLTLDHIADDGAAHRAQYVSRNNEQIYADAKREGWPKERYQLLCMNCNFAKEYYDGCPHERGISTQQVIEELRSKVFHTGKTLQNYEGNKGLAMGPYAPRKAIRVEPDTIETLMSKLAALSEEDLKQLLTKTSKVC